MSERDKPRPKKSQGECPACRKYVFIGHSPQVGSGVICTRCHTELQIVDLNPVSLDWISDEQDYYEFDDINYSIN